MRWKLLNSLEIVSSPWLSVRRNSYELPSGTRVEDYFVLERNDFVLVVARDGEHVFLVHQYRPGTDRDYLSLPAGYFQPPETPEAAAQRELAEETGLAATDFRTIGVLDPLPGYIKSSAHVVVCTVIPGVTHIQDTDEISSVVRMPMQEALELIRTRKLNEMQAVSALLLAAYAHRRESQP